MLSRAGPELPLSLTLTGSVAACHTDPQRDKLQPRDIIDWILTTNFTFSSLTLNQAFYESHLDIEKLLSSPSPTTRPIRRLVVPMTQRSASRRVIPSLMDMTPAFPQLETLVLTQGSYSNLPARLSHATLKALELCTANPGGPLGHLLQAFPSLDSLSLQGCSYVPLAGLPYPTSHPHERLATVQIASGEDIEALQDQSFPMLRLVRLTSKRLTMADAEALAAFIQQCVLSEVTLSLENPLSTTFLTTVLSRASHVTRLEVTSFGILRARTTRTALVIPPSMKCIHSHAAISKRGPVVLKEGFRKCLKDPTTQALTVTFGREEIVGITYP
ncbi:hypothetical protein BKA70DRAFT_254945 [Coprinopsis sp. MPI-PUGE-AT-0042]|nr:hypothetical protein BKA70DRAFT_254945 [Coprinopsis sp. MPI-PUGE-AT-0042]